MTSYERVLNTIEGKGIDRVSAAPEIFGLSARINGYTIKQYVTDAQTLALCQIKSQQVFGYDIVFAFADTALEAEAVGCRLYYPDNAYPYIVDHIIKTQKDIDKLKIPDPFRDGRMPLVAEACRSMHNELKDNCVVTACVPGPISLAAQLSGLETFMFLIADDLDSVEKILNFSEDVIMRYAEALLKSGAHSIMLFDPVASPAVVPPSVFKNLEAPRLKRMTDALRAMGSKFLWLSIAGATQKILPLFSGIGIDLATVDYVVPISDAIRLTEGVIINGNIKPLSFVTAQPDEIKQIAINCINEAEGRFILGSGCEMPLESKPENIGALIDAAASSPL